MKGGDRNCSSCDASSDLAAEDELNEVEADECVESGVERFELRCCEQGGQQNGNERAEYSLLPSTTPSAINDISSLCPRFGPSEPKQPPGGKMQLPSHETALGSTLDTPLGHLLGDYMISLERRLPTVTKGDLPRLT